MAFKYLCINIKIKLSIDNNYLVIFYNSQKRVILTEILIAVNINRIFTTLISLEFYKVLFFKIEKRIDTLTDNQFKIIEAD